MFDEHIAQGEPEASSPGKKRKKKDTRGSTFFNKESNVNSDSNDDDKEIDLEVESDLENLSDEEQEDFLGYIPEEEVVTSPASAMRSSKQSPTKKSVSKRGASGANLANMLQGLNVGTKSRHQSTPISSKPSANNFTTKDAFMCYTWKDKN